MGKSENQKRIILIIALFITVIAGVVFLIFKTKNTIKTVDNPKKLDQESNEPFHYKEELVMEGEMAVFYMPLLKCKFLPSRIAWDEASKRHHIIDINTKEEVANISEDILSASGYWIDNDSIFWTAKYDNEKQKVIVESYEESGKKLDEIGLKNFEGELVDSSYILVKEMRTDKEYIYLLSGTNSIPILQIFTKKGDLVRSYETVDSFDVDGMGKCIYISANTGIHKIDSKSGNEVFTNPNEYPDLVRYDPLGKLIYGVVLGTNSRINVYDGETGAFKKEVFKFGKDSSYMADEYWVKDFLVGDNGSLYFSYMTNSVEFKDIKIKTYAYKKESGERIDKKVTLTVTSPIRNDFIAEAISRYELKYPDEKIKYDFSYNSAQEYEEHYEEYGKKLTLDIISGNISDIITTGNGAVSYPIIARTDAFVDLTPYIEKDESYSKLNKSVLNGLKINNSIRALPLSYVYYQYEVNDDLAKMLGLNLDYNNLSWSKVLKLVKIIEKKAPNVHLFTPVRSVGKNAWEEFSVEILNANLPNLIDVQNKSVNLSQTWFKELLRDFKESSKSKNFVKQLERDSKYDIYDKLKGSLFVLKSNNSVGSGYRDNMGSFARYNKDQRSHLIPIFTGEKSNNRIALGSNMYSINNRSTRKEAAWKFLSFMLEDEINGLKANKGMPINESGLDIVIERSLKDEGSEATRGNKEYERFNNEMKNISQKIDYSYAMDDLRKDITVPIQAYMDDKMTLDEAIKKAEENAMIRLNE